MVYALATREEIARTPGLFADTVAGALNTHALFRVRHLAVPAQQTQADYDLATAILADTDKVLRPAMRMILHSAEQAGLEDVTSLTDQQMVTMVETVWPFLVKVVGA
jgi:hypothetical protein